MLEVLDKPVEQAAVVVTKPWHECNAWRQQKLTDALSQTRLYVKPIQNPDYPGSPAGAIRRTKTSYIYNERSAICRSRSLICSRRSMK